MITGLNAKVNKSDAILILGNKVKEDGSLSQRLKSRLDEGLRLYIDDKASFIVVSGAIGKEEYDEAVVMAEYLIKKNVPKTAIIIDSNGVDTYSSAKSFRAISDENNFDSVIIVSHYYHLHRAKYALKRFGMKKVDTSYARMKFNSRDLYSMPREIVAFYAYLLKSYE